MVAFFNLGRSIHVGLLSIVSPFTNIKRNYLSCAPRLEHSDIVERCRTGTRSLFFLEHWRIGYGN
jgi:hypothetical protein